MSTRSTETPRNAAVRPRRTIKRQQPGVRRQDLLNVTLGCLARFGARGTTGREICRQAGVSHGLLRHYFANPQNLLFETYEEVCDQILAQLGEQMEKPVPSPWASLDLFFESLFGNEFANPQLLGAWLAFWSLVRSEAEFAQKNDSFNLAFRTLLSRGFARFSESTLTVPSEEAVDIMKATTDGLWLEFCLSPERVQPERAIDLCKRTLRQLAPEPA